MRKIDQIIIHCTATPRGREVTTAEIDRWHKTQGYACIGYHYVIGLDGKIHKGRHESIIGAHCKGHNQRSIGVAYVGGTEKNGEAADTRTEAQKESLRGLVKELVTRYPQATVHCHREFSSKACPGFDIQDL